jgi:CubicO group peptidase (beta-lactamase class C family)
MLAFGVAQGQRQMIPFRLRPRITVWHLLTHTAGLAYGFGEPTHPIDQLYQRTELTQPPLTLQYSLPELARKLATLPLVAQPGTEWHYSLAHDVLGYLIEQISGQSCAAFLQERLFTPLGMRDTSFVVPPDKYDRFGPLYSSAEAAGLVVADDVPNSPFIDPAVVPSGGGGLVSSMPDYYRFLSMLAQGGILDGVRVLKESTVTAMVTNQLHGDLFPVRFDTEWPDMGYGLGIGVQTQGAHQYGWIGISGTTAWIYPDEAMIAIALPQALYNWEASDRFLELARTIFTSDA